MLLYILQFLITLLPQQLNQHLSHSFLISLLTCLRSLGRLIILTISIPRNMKRSNWSLRRSRISLTAFFFSLQLLQTLYHLFSTIALLQHHLRHTKLFFFTVTCTHTQHILRSITIRSCRFSNMWWSVTRWKRKRCLLLNSGCTRNSIFNN